MLVTAYLAIVVLLALCVALELTARRITPPEEKLSALANPAFRRFQTIFMRAYLLALWADWLQGPYLYKLYRHYSFLESQIAILYVCGLGSCVLFAPFAGWLPQDEYSGDCLPPCWQPRLNLGTFIVTLRYMIFQRNGFPVLSPQQLPGITDLQLEQGLWQTCWQNGSTSGL
ncbi:hypothetical protein WMY93_027417 [Mugilogobius chulae]|uniref:Uncharacterized protein n=1 Tax=Mugilogobius chulae TaxID=88201 RepID=A0AAW0MZN2_9GOBI